MGFATLKADLLAVESAFAEKNIPNILLSVSKVLADASEIAGLFMASPTDAADKAECKACCDRIAACAEQPFPVSAGPVGKLFPGDGSFLKAIIQLILTLAPLFVEPAPAP